MDPFLKALVEAPIPEELRKELELPQDVTIEELNAACKRYVAKILKCGSSNDFVIKFGPYGAILVGLLMGYYINQVGGPALIKKALLHMGEKHLNVDSL